MKQLRVSDAHPVNRHLALMTTLVGVLGCSSMDHSAPQDAQLASVSEAITISGMGHYCSGTWATGGWAFNSDSSGGDPCASIISTGGTVQRKGLYANNNWNRVVARCYPPNYGWVVIYEGWGNGPLTAAFNAANATPSKPGCIFNATAEAMPIFDSPFDLATSYSHTNGVDLAHAPSPPLDVTQFGQVGSATCVANSDCVAPKPPSNLCVNGRCAATVVDYKGRDRQGYADDHEGHDWPMARHTPLKAVADGVVSMVRDYVSPCPYPYSDSTNQKEVWIKHTVVGTAGSSYNEQFMSYYAHLDSYSVSVGQNVAKGQTLGLSGNTGCSTTPHLHFGVYRISNTSDQLSEPINWFAGPNLWSDARDQTIDPYGWAAPQGFDPWSWQAFGATSTHDGSLSSYLWNPGQAPSLGAWQ